MAPCHIRLVHTDICWIRIRTRKPFNIFLLRVFAARVANLTNLLW